MNKECEMVRDLLPLYVENMVSEASKGYVEEHVKTCTECKQLLDELREPKNESAVDYSSQALPIKKAKKKWLTQIFVICGGCVLAAVVVGFLFGSKAQPATRADGILAEYEREFFNKEQVEVLNHVPNELEKQIADDIIEEAKIVFADYTHTNDEAYELYGVLGRYAMDDYFDADYVMYELDLLGCEIKESTGYVWVNYTNAGLRDHKVVSGSWNINTCWKIEKSADGQWKVVEICEHP